MTDRQAKRAAIRLVRSGQLAYIADSLDNLLKIQGSHGNWDYTPFHHGMFNGLAIATTLVLGDHEDRTRHRPERFLQEPPRQPHGVVTV